MAIYCKECKKIFDKLLPNCPYCGDLLINDEKSETFLLSQQGYTKRKKAASPEVPLDDTDDNSVLDSIRRQFDKEIEFNNVVINATNNDTNATTEKLPHYTASGNSFFDNVSAPEYSTQSQFTPTYSAQLLTTSSDDSNKLTPAQTFDSFPVTNSTSINTRTARDYRLPRIPISTIIRLVLILSVIAFILIIILNIKQIISSMLSFLLSLLPTILFIALIIYLIKRLIHPNRK